MNITPAQLPDAARAVLAALEDAGHETWVVGGWVRDALLGNAAHDVDVCSSACWEDAAAALEAAGAAVHETGTAHGTVTAVWRGTPVEVTTFRVDGAYTDGRHPDEVRFVADVREDLARRDFTINAMAYHPERGLLDPYGGKADLAAGLVRTVGDARTRFEEDYLRVLRAVRFACRYGFAIEEDTQAALASCAGGLAAIARERVGAELDGILATGRAGWALREQTDVMCAALPALGPLVGFEQLSPYHAYDVLEHTARVCDGVEAVTAGLASQQLRWAALLHDVEKPACFSTDATGRGHFFGHPELGAKRAEKTLRGMAIPGGTLRAACALIRMHDYQVNPSVRSVRRTLARLEALCPGRASELAFELIDLKRADALGKAPDRRSYAYELDEVAALLRAELHSRTPVSVRDLAVDGADVMRERGMAPGPEVGAVLQGLLASVLDDALPNDRDALLAELRLMR